jgi:molybdopterin-guanine dinucleotide biosynthesis adapter protein
MRGNGPVVIQVVGLKNAGKTTLVCKLVETLTDLGYEVGTVKHDAHRFEIDHEGKDTWRHREAGARLVAISSEQEGKTCYIEQRYTPLDEILQRMAGMDVVVVEGFKSEGYPKLAIIRLKEHLELLNRVYPVIAIASWLSPEEIPGQAGGGAPVYDVNDLEGLLEEVLALLRV